MIQLLTEDEKIDVIVRQSLKTLAPPPRMTTSEWADRNRWVDERVSSTPGPWRTDRTPYLRGIMDAANDPHVETIVVMKSSRIAGTEAINNIIGYHIDHDPCSMLYVQQSLDEARKYSEQIFTPLIDSTPRLNALVYSDSRTLHKEFPGGNLSLVGAKSPAGFRMVEKRMVICDDIDGFETTVGKEGNPIRLAIKRAQNSWNRLIVLVSSPTVKGLSEIESYFDKSDKRYYMVPCPACGAFQRLEFGGKDFDFGIKWEGDDPVTAYYLCAHCHGRIFNYQKREMLLAGQWQATARFRKTAGFHISALYSPWVTWSDIVEEFLTTKDKPEQLQVFVNTTLGETWEEAKEKLDEHTLLARREEYGPAVPDGACLLTASVDVQDNRLEVELLAWGPGEENWSLDYRVINGDPEQGEVWEELDLYLLKQWPHALGINLGVSACLVDTGGHSTIKAYDFVRPRAARHIFGIKGASTTLGGGKMISDRPSKSNKGKVDLYFLDTHVIKKTITARLKRVPRPEPGQPGPGYLHFPMKYGKEYFEGLTAERLIRFKGKEYWKKKTEGARNEPWDLKVYNYGALAYLKNFPSFSLDGLMQELIARAARGPQPTRPGGGGSFKCLSRGLRS